MQLTKFTDYALRLLIYIAPNREKPYVIAQIAQDLKVSENHLIKIVHFMAKQNWLITTRGKGGGICLHPQTLSLKLGNLIRILENDQPIVDCFAPHQCVLLPRCNLKHILNQAQEQFYQHLNQFMLSDMLKNKNQIPLVQL